MKKMIMMLFIFVFTLTLSACSTVTRNFEMSDDISNVKEVNIYNSEGIYTEGNVHEIINNNKPVYTLDSVQQEKFLNEVES